MGNYIDIVELRKEIILSFGKGYLTDNANAMLTQMINQTFQKLAPIDQLKRTIYQQYVENKLFNTQWKLISIERVRNGDSDGSYPFAWYLEAIKRLISKVYSDKVYVQRAIMQYERKQKLHHLFG